MFCSFCGRTKQCYLKTLWEVMICCVIMHSMIINDKGEDAGATLEFKNMGDSIEVPYQNPAMFDEFVQMHQQIQHRATHKQLKKNLIEH